MIRVPFFPRGLINLVGVRFPPQRGSADCSRDAGQRCTRVIQYRVLGVGVVLNRALGR